MHLHERLITIASAATLALAPLLYIQGRVVRARTPRLPGASGPTTGTVNRSGALLTLLVIGESPVAGVGARTHAEAITGQTGAVLARHTGRAVQWRAVGQIGLSAGQVCAELVPLVPRAPVDLVVIALGVNDTLQFHSAARWQRDIMDLVAALRARVGAAPVLLAAVPMMNQFPALPQPLRGVLGLRASMLDRAARRFAPQLDRVGYAPMTVSDIRGFFCEDGFHPSAAGHAAWGELLAAAAVPLIDARSL